jgi:hypothetical protein
MSRIQNIAYNIQCKLRDGENENENIELNIELNEDEKKLETASAVT